LGPGAVPDALRRDDIDWLKGLAIIGVLLIHSRPLTGIFVGDHIVARAVPVFVVLFGMTSELWWRARAAEDPRATLVMWYRSRLTRLMIPVWGTFALWWIMTLLLHSEPPPTIARVLVTAVGYAPWARTGWFVTLIIELVVLLPLLRMFLARVGPFLAIGTALVLVVVSFHGVESIITITAALFGDHHASGEPAFFYFWIFAPRWFYPLLAGMIAIRCGPAAATRLTAVAAPIAILGLLAESRVQDAVWRLIVTAALDVPVALLLLAVVPLVRFCKPAARFLAWCGASSWGIYLGQLLIFNAFLMLDVHPYDSPVLLTRWAFFAGLLLGSLALVTFGNALRSVLAMAGAPSQAVGNGAPDPGRT
jgi:peptidoglycan/LPS O-acetylase OafA/YrhL